MCSQEIQFINNIFTNFPLYKSEPHQHRIHYLKEIATLFLQKCTRLVEIVDYLIHICCLHFFTFVNIGREQEASLKKSKLTTKPWLFVSRVIILLD